MQDIKNKSVGINKVFQPGSTNMLVLPLIALAFFTGYLFFKVQSLEKQVSMAPTGAPVAGAPAAEPTPNLDAMPEVTDKDQIKGDRNAQVVMVEYSDYQCPFCQRFHPTMQQIYDEYKGKVAWVFRYYPLPFHQYAQKAAEAGECVAKVGGKDKFWMFTDKAVKNAENNDSALTVDNLVKLAGEVGANSASVKSCIESGEMAAKVKADMDGGSQAGVSGTPGTIIVSKNGMKQFVPGALPYEQIKPMIEAALK